MQTKLTGIEAQKDLEQKLQEVLNDYEGAEVTSNLRAAIQRRLAEVLAKHPYAQGRTIPLAVTVEPDPNNAAGVIIHVGPVQRDEGEPMERGGIPVN